MRPHPGAPNLLTAEAKPGGSLHHLGRSGSCQEAEAKMADDRTCMIMATEKQIRASRENAKRSTGPKSLAGKSRSSWNALRHGWSIAMSAGSSAEAQTFKLVELLMPELASHVERLAGLELEQAQAQLLRIATVRRASLATLDLQSLLFRQVRRLAALERHEVEPKGNAGERPPAPQRRIGRRASWGSKCKVRQNDSNFVERLAPRRSRKSSCGVQAETSRHLLVETSGLNNLSARAIIGNHDVDTLRALHVRRNIRDGFRWFLQWLQRPARCRSSSPASLWDIRFMLGVSSASVRRYHADRIARHRPRPSVMLDGRSSLVGSA